MGGRVGGRAARRPGGQAAVYYEKKANSVQLSWDWTELGNITKDCVICHNLAERKCTKYFCSNFVSENNKVCISRFEFLINRLDHLSSRIIHSCWCVKLTRFENFP